MKYTIDYGFGKAYLYTPFNAEERFYTLANTCFGIRKCIAKCEILKIEDVETEYFERLEFNGDVYVWNEYGQRKMIEPYLDEEWEEVE